MQYVFAPVTGSIVISHVSDTCWRESPGDCRRHLAAVVCNCRGWWFGPDQRQIWGGPVEGSADVVVLLLFCCCCCCCCCCYCCCFCSLLLLLLVLLQHCTGHTAITYSSWYHIIVNVKCYCYWCSCSISRSWLTSPPPWTSPTKWYCETLKKSFFYQYYIIKKNTK